MTQTVYSHGLKRLLKTPQNYILKGFLIHWTKSFLVRAKKREFMVLEI